MDYNQKQELISKLEEYGVHKILEELGFEKVKKKGNNIFAICKLHDDADNPYGFQYSNGFSYCHTKCHKKRDLFQITMEAKNVSFNEASEYLAGLVGFEIDYRYTRTIPKTGSSDNKSFLSQIRNKNKAISIGSTIDESILLQYDNILHSSLRKEGFDEKIREYFELGFCRSGYLENRITIPIRDINGQLVSVSGRAIDVNEEKKYKLLFDTDKSCTLYNINNAIKHIKETNKVFLGEGFKFCWRLHQWGFSNCASVMGSSLSEQQKKILLKLGCHIYVIGDRDQAGQLLNEKVKKECGLYSDVTIVDLYDIDIVRKSSVDDITKEEFLNLIKER